MWISRPIPCRDFTRSFLAAPPSHLTYSADVTCVRCGLPGPASGQTVFQASRDATHVCPAPAMLRAAEEKVPGGVHQGVHDGRGEDRAGLAPRPAIKESCDGSEDDVTPVGEAHVRDVREAEEHGSGP